MTRDPAVHISNLTVVYGKTAVLHIPELSLESGKVHVLVGPNGAGKTTLLRAISGLERPTTGHVQVFGRDLYGLSQRERRQVMRRMTLCFQKPYLFNTTVRRNLEYGLSLRQMGAEEQRDRVAAAVEALDLATLAGKRARALSAGETQRVSLARALALEPDLVLLDEPAANVDDANTSRIETAIRTVQERGGTVLAATHQVGQAYRLSANVIRLEAGRVAPPALENVLEGAVEEREGSSLLVLDGGVAIQVTTERRGAIRATVDPSSIIVSRERFESSARNCFPGTIVALSEVNQLIAVTVDIGVRLTAHITRESFARLEATLGGGVLLTFKASSVVVF